MRKPIKRTLWGVCIAIALIIILFAWYGIKASSEVKKLTPVETGQINDSVYAIKDSFVNIFIVKGDEGYVAVDGGNSIEGVRSGLTTLGINPDSVAAILITHTDSDHVKAISLFPKAAIYISKLEEPMVTGKRSRFLFFKNSKLDRPFITLEDNQEIDLQKLKIRSIVVPGHTPGSTCYLVNNKYLFTGDAIGLKDGKIIGFNDFFNMDTKTALKSMDKIIGLDRVEYILTAHHGYTNNYKDAVKDWKNQVEN